MEWLYIALGGALGACLRKWMTDIFPYQNFPWGTLTVNVLGAFVIGWGVFYWGRHYGHTSSDLFLRVGLCGGFTTFSSFTLETMNLLENGAYGVATLYIISSLCGCLLAIYIAKWSSV